MPVEAKGKMQEGERREERRNKEYGLERMVAGAGFRKAAELGDETGAKKKQDDGEVPEDRKKIEAVAGARVGNGFLIFFGREVVGGGGSLSGRAGGRCGSGSGLESNRIRAGSPGYEEEQEQGRPEQAEPGARGRGEVHGKSIAGGLYSRASAEGDLQISGRVKEGNCAAARAGVFFEMRAKLRQEAEEC